MDLSPAALIASLLVSSAGFGLFLYGRKQDRIPQLLAGLVMMGCPYFVPGALGIWGVGTATTLALVAALRQNM